MSRQTRNAKSSRYAQSSLIRGGIGPLVGRITIVGAERAGRASTFVAMRCGTQLNGASGWPGRSARYSREVRKSLGQMSGASIAAMEAADPVRVLRVIARLNVGGPALHVSYLTGELDKIGYQTLLVAGKVAEGEGSMDYAARERGIEPVYVPSLQR